MNNQNPTNHTQEDKRDILEALKNKNIEPHSKLFFQTKKAALLSAILTGIIATGAILSTIIFLILDRDDDIFVYLDRNYYQHVLYGIPFFWIVLLLVLIYIILIIQKKVGRGYRTGIEKVFPVVLIVAGCMGWIFFLGGLRDTAHTFLYKNVTAYRPLTDSKEQLWDNPDNGMVFGKISQLTEDGFILQTDDKGSWDIYMPEETVFGPHVHPLHPGQIVKITGNPGIDNTFESTIIQNWSEIEQD